MATSQLSDSRLLDFARRLQSLQTHDELLRAVADEVRETVGYNTTWMAVLLPESNSFKVLTIQGPGLEDIWDTAAEIPIEGDAYVSALVETGEAQVIEDAQTDDRVNREIVRELGNRTIVNVPMMLIDQAFGALGTGTFGDEGPRLPTDDELAYLHDLAHHVVVASARILLATKREEAIRHAAETDRILARRQRIESLGELAGGVAHDFNNLLMVISASAQLLKEQVSTPEAAENLRMIETSVSSASDLASQLLALGKRQDLHFEPSDIGERVLVIGEMLRRVLGAGVEVVIDAETEMLPVMADTGQIDQVLMNLGLNARDAMPDGGKLVLSACGDEIDEEFTASRPWARAGRYVRIDVADNGVGMAPETIDRIYDPFFTTKSDTGGTGLGLSVTRGIVEQHGGLIRTTSKPGRGTIVSVYLPVIDR